MLSPDRDPGAANNAIASVWNGSIPDEHIWGGADPEDLPVVEDCSTVIGVSAEIEGNTRMWPCSDLGFSCDLSAYNHGNAENTSESDESSAESEPLEWEGSVRHVMAKLNELGIEISRGRVHTEIKTMLHYCSPTFVCYLNDDMKRQRHNFAAEWLLPKHYGAYHDDRRSTRLLNKIKKWIFTDEKVFYTFGSNTKRASKWVEIGGSIFCAAFDFKGITNPI